MKVSVIMAMHNRWDLTHARLAEMRNHLPKQECEIILVDDCSTDEDVRSGVAFWQKSGIALHPIKYVRNETNLGFTKTMNNGYRVATGDIAIFYSNDVILTGNVVDDVLRVLETSDKPALVGNRLIFWDSGWNSFNVHGKVRIVPYLEGFFIACRSRDWNVLGGWDERYSPYDYEDMDLSFRAFLLGYDLVELNSPHIRHLGGQTIQGINPQREAVTKTNRARFLEKWVNDLEKLG